MIPKSRCQLEPRRGVIVILSAFLIVALMALLALSIDMGYMYTMETQMDRAVDAAALAGVSALSEDASTVEDQIVEYLVRNPVGQENNISEDANFEAIKAAWLEQHGDNLQYELGYWNSDTAQFQSTSNPPSAIEISLGHNDLPLFFGRVLGRDKFSVHASAIASYQPRDIILAIDLSGSMNDDSELKSISRLGRETVEDNLLQIYEELGSPQYGELPYTPDWVTVTGIPPTAGSLPQITVKYRKGAIDITSTKDISNVVIEMVGGTTIRDESFTDGDTAATMSVEGEIAKVWVKSGANADYSMGYGELFDFTANNTFIEALGLNNVEYPYPSGSWSSYVDYVRSGSHNADAGYQYKFGHLNLTNYWLEKKPANYQTPDLWEVSAQPLAAVKDAVEVFTEYVREIDTKDRIGLAVYNSNTGEGSLEVPLTFDLDAAAAVTRHRQAGHYHSMTNIGAGLSVASDELAQNGRSGAFKLVVLLTDGQANFFNGASDTTAARNYVITEAQRAKSLKYSVMTVSLGAGADQALMDDVAELTGGVHFNVPAGQTVTEYRQDLYEAFREIAKHRPVRLVK